MANLYFSDVCLLHTIRDVGPFGARGAAAHFGSPAGRSAPRRWRQLDLELELSPSQVDGGRRRCACRGRAAAAPESDSESPGPGPSMQFEMRLQTVVGEFYSEVGYNFNFEKP